MTRKEFEEARRKFREAMTAIRWSRQRNDGKYADNKGGGVLFDALHAVTDYDVRESCHQHQHYYFEINCLNARWTLTSNSRGLMVEGRKGVSA